MWDKIEDCITYWKYHHDNIVQYVCFVHVEAPLNAEFHLKRGHLYQTDLHRLLYFSLLLYYAKSSLLIYISKKKSIIFPFNFMQK